MIATALHQDNRTAAAVRYRELAPARKPDFVATGRRPSQFFAHRFHVLPKCGPDGFKLARRMCGEVVPEDAAEIVLYATSPQLDEFPPELFFDDDLVWHRQQFGLPGQIATANLVRRGACLYSMVHIADVVQRIGRCREHKTRIENRFRGWIEMLLNAVMNVAQDEGVAEVRTPTAAFARRHTDPRRNPAPEMFERIYDRSVDGPWQATRDGDWWRLPVAANRDRIVVADAREIAAANGARTICIVHDVERGMGHADVDAPFAADADAASPASLEAMLAIERAAGVRATYSVVGTLYAELQPQIAPDGHALAFHSYDHVVDGPGADEQLARCRGIDYRAKGYRPPRSRLTAECADENLLHHNFEWLASSRYSLGFAAPRMTRGLVRLPIAFDDFALYKEGMPYADWERDALAAIEANDYVAFGLHDCYAPHWLPHYRRLLDRVQALGAITTLDAVAASVTLRSGR
jgi:hypothetical protein